MRRLLVALVLLAACSSDKGQIRVVERPAPPRARAPRRFELVETATVETGSKVELWFPLASDDAGVQEIERLDVVIKPDTRYRVSNDSRGNRTLYLEATGPVSVRVAYRVKRSELRVELPAKRRELTPAEKKTFGSELGPAVDAAVDELRRAGTPARRVCGIDVQLGTRKVRRGTDPGTEVPDIGPKSWVEIYEPGLAWVPAPAPGADSTQLPPGSRGVATLATNLLIVARGTDDPLPVSKIDGVEAAPKLAFSAHELEAP